MSDDDVIRVDARVLSLEVDGPNGVAKVTLRTDLDVALRRLVFAVNRDVTIALVVRRDDAAST